MRESMQLSFPEDLLLIIKSPLNQRSTPIMKFFLATLLYSLAHIFTPGFGQEAPATPDANLPKVLLIGDSISGGYSKEVKRLLEGKASVTGPIANAEATIFGVTRIDDWIGTTKWDLIHFNWGLWAAQYFFCKIFQGI
jgi:hypothetical protein